MGQIVGNAQSARNYKTQALVAREEGRARQAAYNNKANNLEEEARADSHLAALNMSRQRGNQTAAQSSVRAQHASTGLTSEGSGSQNELALADLFEKTIADMALSNAISDNNKRTSAMTTRQQGKLAMMQADSQAEQYRRLGKSAQNAAWIQGGVTLLSALAGGLGSSGAGGSISTPGTAGATLPSWATGALSSGQSAYDLTGNLLQWSPGTVSSSKESATNAGNALNDLLVALLGQSSTPGNKTSQP